MRTSVAEAETVVVQIERSTRKALSLSKVARDSLREAHASQRMVEDREKSTAGR